MTIHKPPMPRAVTRTLNGWLKRRAKIARRPLNTAITLGALSGLLLIPEAWLLAKAVTGVIFGHRSLSSVMPLLWPLVGLFFLRALMSHGSTVSAVAASARVKRDLRQAIHAKIARLGPAFIGGERSGELASLLVEGVDTLDKYYTAYLPQMTVAAFLPIALLVAVLPADWVSGVILMVGAPLIPIFMIVIGKGTERLNQAQWQKLALMSAQFFDVVEGLTTLKLFGASRYEAEIIGRISDEYRQSTMSVLRVAFLSSLVLEFFTTLGVAMVAVFIGFRLYYGQMHFQPGFFVLLLAPEFFRPLRAMGTQYHARMDAIAASERLVALLDTPEPNAAPGTDAAPARISTIRFEDVHFAYRAGQPALAGVDLTLTRGERVALVGPSGSGKSTLARLLLGLATPDQGRITLDGTDLTTIALDDWFAHISWMPQRPTLFAGTIADNIRLALPHAPDTAVMQAARAAAADTFIQRLPAGYDTVIGERGQGLSGGEIRRIALARALLKPADVLILDEAEASLDQTTATVIHEAIAALPTETTVLLIAHRLETAEAADRIVVLRDGRIIEAGRPEDLRAQPGAYAEMAALYHEGAL